MKRSPDEQILHDPKPAFPEWLKKLYPMLRAEETNALFLAVRRRRLIYAPTVMTTLKMYFDPKILALFGVIAFVIVSLFTIPVFFPAASILVFIGMMLFWPTVIAGSAITVLARNARKKRGGRPHLPARTGSIFGPGGYEHQAALDMWMCGYSGRDVAESILLENYERAWRWVLIVPFFFTAFLSFPYLLTRWPFSVWDVVALLSLVLPIYGMMRLGLLTAFEMAGTRPLHRRYGFWKHNSALVGALSEMGRQMTENFLMRISIAAMVGAFLFIGAMALAFVINVLPKTGLKELTGPAGLLCVSITVATMLYVLRRMTENVNIKNCQKAIDAADYAFDALMAGAVCEDPDGEAWARWRHHIRTPGDVASAPSAGPQRMT